MNRWHWPGSLFVLGLLLIAAAAVEAREPTQRTPTQKSSGARTDITIPYLTSGNSAFMANYVAPRIYASPIVDDPRYPQQRPVYNLPFYGAVQSFGDVSVGAAPRTK